MNEQTKHDLEAYCTYLGWVDFFEEGGTIYAIPPGDASHGYEDVPRFDHDLNLIVAEVAKLDDVSQKLYFANLVKVLGIAIDETREWPCKWWELLKAVSQAPAAPRLRALVLTLGLGGPEADGG